MKNVYEKILFNRKNNHKMLVVLLDPDQCQGSLLSAILDTLKKGIPDFIFVGGSHINSSVDNLIAALKKEIEVPIVLFPGNASQFSQEVDALLYLSLISGRNAEYLIGQHVISSFAIKQSGIEVISTAYLLIDGGKVSAVEYMSNTRSIPREKKEIVVSTALAGELLGMQMIYFEAGSGAIFPVPKEVISYVKSFTSIPIAVGGGIQTTEKLKECFDAGADIAVVGNLFEIYPNKIQDFIYFTHQYNEKTTLV